jgi:hypothetical protein
MIIAHVPDYRISCQPSCQSGKQDKQNTFFHIYSYSYIIQLVFCLIFADTMSLTQNRAEKIKKHAINREFLLHL